MPATPAPKLATYSDLWATPAEARAEVSPSTAARDRVTKRNLYARSGVAHYWLIDPEARVFEALALRDEAGSS